MVFCVYALFYRLLYSRRTETVMKSLEKLIKRSGTVRNDHETIEDAQERSGTVNVKERSVTVNGQERVGKIESERSNALERIVENGHGTVTLRDRNGNEKFRKAHKTVRNDNETVENGRKRSGTVRNDERPVTPRNDRVGTQ
jgi:hypothetical protein